MYIFVSKGVNVVKRKLAEHDNLKITIEQNGNNFHIKESSTFRTKDIEFTLGVPFDYTLADGTEVSVSDSDVLTLSKNKLKLTIDIGWGA